MLRKKKPLQILAGDTLRMAEIHHVAERARIETFEWSWLKNKQQLWRHTHEAWAPKVWMPVFEVLHSRNLSYPKMDVHVPPSNSWATMDLFPNMASPWVNSIHPLAKCLQRDWWIFHGDAVVSDSHPPCPPGPLVPTSQWSPGSGSPNATAWSKCRSNLK